MHQEVSGGASFPHPFFSSLHPLANRPFGNPHDHGDVLLLPARLVQLPSPELAVLPPIGNLTRKNPFHGTIFKKSLKLVQGSVSGLRDGLELRLLVPQMQTPKSVKQDWMAVELFYLSGTLE